MSSNFKGVNSAGKMKRMMSRKSHSWWWDSHISPKNSKWLAENLEEMDRSVKEMLKLIEEEGDSFAKKAEMYYQKRPELVAHVEDFYRMYRALAERYDHVTGELRKNVDLNSQGSGSGSDFGSEPPSPSLPSKPAIPKPGRRAAGFDFFLGSGGSSDRSRKGSDDDSSSSPSSESDSDTDDNTKDFNGNGNGLDERISELENELSIVKEKLCEHANCEQKHAYLSSKISALENDILAANEKLAVSEAEKVRLQQHLHEKNLTSEAMSAELSYENLVISKLEGQVDELENEIKMNKLEIEEFKGVILANDLAIEQYKTQLAEASNKSAQEKSHLEADIMNFEGFIEEFKANVERISGEKLQLETNLLAANEKLCVSEAEIVSLEQKLQKGDSASEAMSAELSYENQVISKLEGHVGELESEIKELKGVISANDQVIEQYKTQLAEAFSKSAQEKSHFEADIVKLEGVIKELKAEIERLSDEKLQLGTNLAVANEKLGVSETEIMSLQEKLQEGILTTQAVSAELSYENRVISKLEKQVNELESELKRSKRDIEDLKGLISANDQAIEQYKAQLIEASSKFIEEKSHLEADIIHREEVVKELKTEIERNSQLKLQLETNLLERQHTIEELKAAAEISAYSFSQEKSSLNAQISSLSKSTTSLGAKLIQLEAEKAEACKERDGQIADINQSFEALKQRITLLLVEKEELSGRVTALIKDIKIQDDRVVRMDEHLHQLHLEHVKLMKEIEESRRAGRELREKVKELEEEVEKQRIAISDGAEGKREAIRQLCFSLEHYRDGYNHLRQMLMQGHSKRPTTVMAV